jgi:cobalt-zinc-cadmium efflux system outer membrane protein
LPKATSGDLPAIVQPLAFPSRAEFRSAVLNRDAELARLYLDEFHFVLGGEVRLKAMEYQAASETAVVAQDLAARITALVRMLEERPAAGVESLIERRILEGAALPFIKEAVDSSLRAALLRMELNGLLGRKVDGDLTVAGSFEPLPELKSEKSKTSLLFSIREAQIARGLLGMEAASEVESFAVGGWFTREGLGSYESVKGVTRPGGTSGGTSAETKARLLADAQAKLAREATQRRLAVNAAREVLKSLPATLIENLQKASDLAERQYRVGALGVNLLLETHREYLEALKTREEASIQAWRNILDLELLHLAPTGLGKITVTPRPTNETTQKP